MFMFLELLYDACQKELSEWRAQENEWLLIGISRTVIGWKKINETASLEHKL